MKKTIFITVEICGKAYDYPKDFHLPKIGDLISIDHSPIAKVNRVLFQIIDKDFRMITINTEDV